MDYSVTPPKEALQPEVLQELFEELRTLRRALIVAEDDRERALGRIDPVHLPSARNLLHYVGLRRLDLRALQQRLARAGLSSLGRAESHVLVTLDRVLGMLSLAQRRAIPRLSHPPVVGFRHGEALLARNADGLLGPPREGRRARIMVTMPSEAASDPSLVLEMVRAGMQCARINCAHDSEAEWGSMIDNVGRARRDLGQPVRVLMDLAGPKIRTGAIRSDGPVRVRPGDEVILALPGFPVAGEGPAVIEFSEKKVFRGARAGEPIWLDDGKTGGRITHVGPAHLVFEVSHAKRKGTKLKPEKGINLPFSRLKLGALTEEDRRNMRFIADYADAVSLSFVERPKDVRELIDALDELEAAELGLVLKIEKPAAFERIPKLLLTAMRRPRIGMMIARGDLAVEVGFERLAEAQEELLWFAEAAHVPTIWATQVLEQLAKTGQPSRAEITDAAMSARAEAVMLNKGPHVLEAIRALDDILRRMQGHQSKKRQLLRPLGVARKSEFEAI